MNDLLTRLVRNDDVPAGPWPSEMAEYLGLSARLPDWADARLIRTGENVFLRYGLSSFGVLACAKPARMLRPARRGCGTRQYSAPGRARAPADLRDLG